MKFFKVVRKICNWLTPLLTRGDNPEFRDRLIAQDLKKAVERYGLKEVNKIE